MITNRLILSANRGESKKHSETTHSENKLRKIHQKKRTQRIELATQARSRERRQPINNSDSNTSTTISVNMNGVENALYD